MYHEEVKANTRQQAQVHCKSTWQGSIYLATKGCRLRGYESGRSERFGLVRQKKDVIFEVLVVNVGFVVCTPL